MKKILGLDLGTNSIGWALVNEAESENEKSSIIKLGVRVNPLTVDELTNFEKGKSITTNADRTLKRSMRRNLQRYKLRKESLIKILRQNNWITEQTILSENGNKSTFETYRLRAKAAIDEVSLEEFARILLMINRKRGYKSSRKAKSTDEGQLIDGMEVAKRLYNENLTPGQLCYQLLKDGKKSLPDFYRSDLQTEFEMVFDKQLFFHPEFLSVELKEELRNKKRDAVWAICAKTFKERGFELVGTKRKGNTKEQKTENFEWRAKAVIEKLELEQIVVVLQQINIQLNNSSGYLGAISDRSKELYFNKQTVGQYLMEQLEQNPHARLKNQVFYRQDYLDEFNTLWETQAKFNNELTTELKSEIRDVIIFFQRRLKSQKGLISFCEFESKKIEVEVDGKKKLKTIGMKVCPKSSPLFQEFKIWQILNNIQVNDKSSHAKRFLEQEEKEILFAELSFRDKLSKADALKLLFKNHKELDLNYKDIEGNRTQAALFNAYNDIIELSGHEKIDFSKCSATEFVNSVTEVFTALGIKIEILHFDSSVTGDKFDKQPMYQLWHLLYSFEGDNSNTGQDMLIETLSARYGFEKEYAKRIASVTFQPDYGSLSSKAIRKILPHLKDGFAFAGRKERPEEPSACEYAGYQHSKSSLTKEKLDKKELKDKLDILPKNSLRNPVVEKILNQMINVVNAVSESYGKPDEIRIELARELKKSAKEREELTTAINQTTTEHEKYRQELQQKFGLSHVSRNDIVRYKLYLELEPFGFKTLYSQTYISPDKLFSGDFDIEHIIPQSRLFDDSFSNKTLETRSENLEKGNDTAIEFIERKYGKEGLADYVARIDGVFKNNPTKQGKLKKLKMKGDDIPDDFINRDLRDTQYIAKKAKSILEEFVRDVVSTTGSITDRLREDWQLINVMQELNWNKYDKLGLTENIIGRDGQEIPRIKDWTKRNDHRHHAMDALTIAFTKRSHIQYLNNLNARSDKAGSIYGIELKELYRDDKGKLKFKSPMPLNEFRAEAKKHLENTLISIKAKNKVTTININTTKKKGGTNKKKQLTPRGQLHDQTVYGSNPWSRIELSSKISKNEIDNICSDNVKASIKEHIKQIGSIAKAFTEEELLKLRYNNKPLREVEINIPCHTQRIDITKFFTDSQRTVSSKIKNLKSVLDLKIREILNNRLDEFGGDFMKAFSDLETNPIWLNKEKGISIKRITMTGISNALALHDKKDKEGNLILDKDGKTQPVDFVNTGNNHHVAIYRDEKGNLQDNVVSFFEATERVNQGMPIVDKEFKKKEGWVFLFSMKQNEYFVFPRTDKKERINEETGEMKEVEVAVFNPKEIDLFDSDNYNLISPNLYKVQTMSKVMYGNNVIRDYKFRHHLETSVKDVKELKDIAFKQYKTLAFCDEIVKVRVNHIGQIVSIGEY